MKKLFGEINMVQSRLPQAQKLVAEYVFLNYSEIPFQTISKIAQDVGVSESTIVKFYSSLGYKSFSDFKGEFIKHLKSELSLYSNFKDRIELVNDSDSLTKVMQYDISNIEITLNRLINTQNLIKFIDMIDDAKNIYVCGRRSASMLMDYLSQSLRVQGYKVIPFDLNGHYIDQLSQITKNDLFISFSFLRYTSSTIESLKYISNKKIPCISFTDSTLSPLYDLADLSFVCETKSYSYQASYVGVLSLLNVLIVMSSIKNKEKTQSSIKNLEETLKYFKIFDNDQEPN